jgi:hypothetical protein
MASAQEATASLEGAVEYAEGRLRLKAALSRLSQNEEFTGLSLRLQLKAIQQNDEILRGLRTLLGPYAEGGSHE